MRSRGVSTTGFLIALAVIAIAACLLYFINRSVLLNDQEADDITKMREIVGAIDLYETENNERAPAQLADVQSDVGDVHTFLSSGDPYGAGSDFPIDPAFPDSRARTKFRISYTYLPQWIAHGKFKDRNWDAVFRDSKVGLLACYWFGETTHLRPDGLNALGPVVRINMDGSALVLTGRNKEPLLTGFDLFNLK